MIDKEQFIKSVLNHFDFLIKDYHFHYNGFLEDGRNDKLIFVNGNLLMEIKYNYPNKYFDVNLFCNNKNMNQDYRYWEVIGLEWIVIKYETLEKKYLYDQKFENLEETIQFKASLLKQYGNDLLSGRKWFSWIDVSGWGKSDKIGHARVVIDGKVIQDYDFKIDNKQKSNSLQAALDFFRKIFSY